MDTAKDILEQEYDFDRDGIDAEVDRIGDAYDEWQAQDHTRPEPAALYREAEAIVDDIDYSREAVYRFCEEAPIEGGEDGLFISALSNRLDEDPVVLPLHARGGEPFEWVGYQNEKTLVLPRAAGKKLGDNNEGVIYAEQPVSTRNVAMTNHGEVYRPRDSGDREGGWETVSRHFETTKTIMNLIGKLDGTGPAFPDVSGQRYLHGGKDDRD